MGRVPDPIVAELAARRREWGWSPRHVHAAGGPPGHSTLYGLEAGRHVPTLPTLRQWAAALGYELVLREVTTDG